MDGICLSRQKAQRVRLRLGMVQVVRPMRLGWPGYDQVQLWLPDTTSPEFAQEAERQAKLVAEWERTSAGHEELEFWQSIAVRDDR